MRLVGAVALVASCGVGCGASSPRASRALAVGLAALGTGAAVAAQSCVSQSDEVCGDTAASSGVAVLGVALAASATAWLEAIEADQRLDAGVP